MTLKKFLSDCPKAVLWYISVGSSAGTTEFVCPTIVDDMSGRADWQGITGTVTNGVWEWDGSGNPTDYRRNSVLRISVQSDPKQWKRLKADYEAQV